MTLHVHTMLVPPTGTRRGKAAPFVRPAARKSVLKQGMASLLLMMGAYPGQAADQLPYLPSVEARFRTHLDQRKSIASTSSRPFSDAALAAYRVAEKRLADQLIAMPQVNAPPPGLCLQVGSWAEGGTPYTPLLGGNVSVVAPTIIGGKCSKLEGEGISLRLNDLHDLIPYQSGADRLPAYFAADLRFPAPGVIASGTNETDQLLVLTRIDKRLVIPFPARSYLTELLQQEEESLAGHGSSQPVPFDRAHWMKTEGAVKRAELLKSFAFLPPEQARTKAEEILNALANGAAGASKSLPAMNERHRAASLARISRLRQRLARVGQTDQACLDSDRDAEVACAPGNRLWSINPAYFDGDNPSSIQVVTMATSAPAQRFEDGLASERRLLIWNAIDRARIHKLIIGQ